MRMGPGLSTVNKGGDCTHSPIIGKRQRQKCARRRPRRPVKALGARGWARKPGLAPYTRTVNSNIENASAISVSELNRRARTLLEQGMTRVWVVGELSNLARPASGHLYFSLKDDSAQIRCAWFLQRQRGPTIGQRSGFKDGDQMLAFGRVSIYEARGDYQLIVEQLEPAGEGALRRQFELLKKKLADEGLFDATRKKALPTLPGRIRIITSPSGAAGSGYSHCAATSISRHTGDYLSGCRTG
jgi:hypothetical protein